MRIDLDMGGLSVGHKMDTQSPTGKYAQRCNRNVWRSNLEMDVIVVPRRIAPLEADFGRGKAQALDQMRLEENPRDPWIIGQPLDGKARALDLQRQVTPEGLQPFEIPPHGGETGFAHRRPVF